MKVYIETYGCAANQGDASIMQGVIEKRGHEIVEDAKFADAIIIVTCTVIDTTQQRMLSRIKKFKEKYKGKKIIVAGCMASAQPDLIKKVASDAILVSPLEITSIGDVIEGEKAYKGIKAGLERKIDIKLNFPISDGCLYNCSYCITKKARGNLIFYPMDLLYEDIKDAISKGCREIRLTSQDTASYPNLPELIEKVSSIEGNFRIRVGMMHPLSAYKILDEIIEAFKNEKVYKFLHLPLQSASEKILKKMNRRYTFDIFCEIVKAFRREFDITLATDIIVAFPGESEEDFNETIEAIKQIEPDVTNVTRFSPRPSTPSWRMERMPTEIAKERSRVASKVANEISLKRNRKWIGKKTRVLILDEYKGWKVGKNDFYKSVFLKSGEIGEFLDAKIFNASITHLEGEILKG
ncbi:MAG: tRNA (N(6)-L-threonylcarbamoyladenosine(37)-C(2))-methylthiotransferase [Thermoplasmatales archaeon]|nr:tRNA (N(6)-L-threonylcarbamoyladenosine(37)-C(2))-methylthiotransferase [Thermoplasmatales archaeon]